MIFREGDGKEREREGEKHQCERQASQVHPSGDQTRTPGMCPDRKSNWGPFALQADAQQTEPQLSGLKRIWNIPKEMCWLTMSKY